MSFTRACRRCDESERAAGWPNVRYVNFDVNPLPFSVLTPVRHRHAYSEVIVNGVSRWIESGSSA